MKILIIEPCAVNTGGYFRSFNIAKSLSRNDIAVDLLVSSNKKFQFLIKKKKVTLNFIIFELPRIDLNPYFNFTGRIIRGFIGLFLSFRKRYDVIHVCNPTQFESNIPGVILKLFGKKVVMGWDDYFVGSPLFENMRLTKKYVKFCENRAPKFFENMVVISDYLEKMAKNLGAKRVVKIINGVSDLSRIDPYSKNKAKRKLGLWENKKYLFAFGNTHSWERTLKMLRILKRICELDQNVMLITNFDPYLVLKNFQKDKEIDLKYKEKVLNVGYIPEEDIAYYLSAVDAAIFIQGEYENDKACFPTRVISYIGAELITIINDINSEIVTILKKYGCAIIDKKETVLAKKTVDFLNNQNLQKDLKEKVKKAKEELSQDKIVLRLIDFYKSLS